MMEDGNYQDIRDRLDELEGYVERVKYEDDVEAREQIARLCINELYAIRKVLEKERRKD